MKAPKFPFKLRCHGCGDPARELIGWTNRYGKDPTNYTWMLCCKCFDLADAWALAWQKWDDQRHPRRPWFHRIQTAPEFCGTVTNRTAEVVRDATPPTETKGTT